MTAARVALLAGLLPVLCGAVQASGIGRPVSLSHDHHAGEPYMGIRHLGAIQLPVMEHNGLRLSELSGLAWDEDGQVLYALSDNGKLFHLRPVLERGTLQDVELLDAVALQDGHGRPLADEAADSEGLAIENGADGVAGNSRLLVSFEREHRIVGFDVRGMPGRQLPLPPPLNDPRAYRTVNKGLESLALHPRMGPLTGAEFPLAGNGSGTFTLHDLHGRSWRIPRHDDRASGLVAIEAMPDGDLLVMQRLFRFVLYPPSIILQRIRINDRSAGSDLPAETVAVFDNADGWMIDNFEGLAHHEDNRYFMVSDDNEHFLQRTLLFYFEVVE